MPSLLKRQNAPSCRVPVSREHRAVLAWGSRERRVRWGCNFCPVPSYFCQSGAGGEGGMTEQFGAFPTFRQTCSVYPSLRA